MVTNAHQVTQAIAPLINESNDFRVDDSGVPFYTASPTILEHTQPEYSIVRMAKTDLSAAVVVAESYETWAGGGAQYMDVDDSLAGNGAGYQLPASQIALRDNDAVQLVDKGTSSYGLFGAVNTAM